MIPEKVFDLEKLKERFSKYLAIDEDREAIDVILACAIEQFIPGDPLWLMVIAPSGALKTELLRSLIRLKHAFLLSNLTSRTIISGYESKSEKRIIRGIHDKINNHLVVIPELSEVLTKNHEERSQIFSQLRDLYDGHVVYGYGTTDAIIDVHCRIGLICGMTGAIDLYTTHQAVLGERFLRIRPKWDRAKALQAAMEQEDMELERMGMAIAVEDFVGSLKPFTEDHPCPKPSEEQKTRIGYYAKLVAYLRVVVSSRAFRDLDTTEWVPEIEFPTRIAKQLKKIAILLAVVRGKPEIAEAEMATVRRVAFDTCSTLRFRITQTLYKAKNPLTIQEIAVGNKIGWRKAETSVNALVDTGVASEHTPDEAGYEKRFISLQPEIRSLLDSINKADASCFNMAENTAPLIAAVPTLV